jgi:hypothetical protein
MMAGVFLLAGCSSPGAESESGDSGLVEDSSAGGTVADRAAPEHARSGPSGANRTTVRTRAVIRRGSITVVATEMNRARTAVDDLLGRHGGYLASEDTTNDRSGRPEYSLLVLRVPEPAFGDAMDELGDIGRTVRADRSSEDVTTEVIDVDSRVATAEASLARLQRFLRQAERVEDMIKLESEIATRQAELESMKAQQTYLRDQTSLSTITVRLRTPDAPPVAPADDAGFLTGLANGWAALRTVLVGLATVTGAMLPFVLAIGVLAVPALLLVRTARRRRQTATPPPAPEAG